MESASQAEVGMAGGKVGHLHALKKTHLKLAINSPRFT